MQESLTLVWHEGVLGERLIDLARDYTDRTGIAVRGRLLPWSEWHSTIAAHFAAAGSEFDLVILDSQSMSEFASQGHVLLLNPYLEESARIQVRDFDPSSLKTYGEYPEGSGEFYALPINQDTMGLVYRKDLFEDEGERAGFRARYGYDLAPPETYSGLRDVAEFFTRPGQDLYGIALYGSEAYDGVTSAFNNVLWSFGGELWQPETRQAEGVINSTANVAALEFFKTLFDCSPPGGRDWYYEEVNEAVHTGRVAMAINWFYFFSAHADPKTSSFADRVGFALLPGQEAADGTLRRHHSVGGQGVSVSRYSPRREAAWAFLEWFMSNEVQWRWAHGGGQTSRVDILNHPDYASATPYNALFPTAMSRVKDYWHLVEYPQLLAAYQRHTHAVVAGEVTPREGLDHVAREHQAILDASRP